MGLRLDRAVDFDAPKDGQRHAYEDALERCKLDKRGRPPRADQIQVLVSAWRGVEEGQLVLSYRPLLLVVAAIFCIEPRLRGT
jgi:hypothetical protein